MGYTISKILFLSLFTRIVSFYCRIVQLKPENLCGVPFTEEGRLRLLGLGPLRRESSPSDLGKEEKLTQNMTMTQL